MLQQEDYKSIIKVVMPGLEDFKIKSLGPTEFSVTGMVEVDFLVHINSKKHGEFLLHIEFESFYKSNIEMMTRMANYYSHIRSYSNLPIYQVLVVLNKSKSVKKIESSFSFEELGLKRKFEYKVIEIYKMNKEEVLKNITKANMKNM